MKMRNVRRQFAQAVRNLAWLLGAGLLVPTAQAATHYQLLKSLPSFADSPMSPLIQGSDGALYGTACCYVSNGLASVGVFKLSTDGSRYQVYAVDGSYDASVAHGALLEGRDGALYGAALDSGDFGWGSVFKVNKDGTGYAVLYSFREPGAASGDGSDPVGALLEGTNAVLYGTTLYGGAFGYQTANGAWPGYGTVFKLNSAGTGYTVLHSFGGSPGDGQNPTAGLLQGSDGVLYGTTAEGGAYTNQYGQGFGTMFKLNTDGTGYSVLHSFGGGDAGSGGGPLIEGRDGELYGVGGTVFKLNKEGSGYTVLHTFGGGNDGSSPVGSLAEGNDKALYGTTILGGSNQRGIVFKVNQDGTGYSVVYNFGDDSGGNFPLAGLLKGRDNVFYGTTSGNTIQAYSNGFSYSGAVFKLWPPETPDMVGLTTSRNIAQVSFSGASNYQYQVLRSTNLTTWAVLTNFTMPSAGVYLYTDGTPPNAGAYYRAAWVP